MTLAVPKELTIRLWQLLADQEWHDAHAIREQLADSVNPGIAFRQAKAIQQQTWVRRHGDKPMPDARADPARKARMVRIGQIAFAHKTMTASARAGRARLELTEPGDRDPTKLTRGDWARRAPMRIRWTGHPYGVYAEPTDEKGGRLARIAGWHDDDGTGRCTECSQQHPCRTYLTATATDPPDGDDPTGSGDL